MAQEPVTDIALFPSFRFDRAWALALLAWPVLWFVLRTLPPRFPLRRPSDHRHRFLHRSFWVAAMSLLIVGFAGPRWGRTDRGGVAVGRDVMIVIDLSRSMQATDLAEPKPRWKAATDAAAELVRAAGVRGGHRLGVVVFAARAKVLVPLTTDYEHLLQSLDELDGDARPLEIRPDETSVSGTRIGAALKLAADAHDRRFPGVQDIVLLGDGDDPAEDREWAQGIAPARAAGIPIHAVGIGGTEDTPLLLKKKGSAEGELVSTRLHEEVLAEIAHDGRGTYLPARRDPPRLGEFFHRTIEPLPSREFGDDAVATRRDRSGWFFALGFAVFLLAWWKAPI